MALTPHALVLLHAQRHHLANRPDERELTRAWAHEVDQARTRGELVVIIQWDGETGSDHETFSRGWILHPDFRAETGDLLIRAVAPDAFLTSGLDADLRARAVQHVRFLGLPGKPETAIMPHQAAAHGYAVNPLAELENA